MTAVVETDPPDALRGPSGVRFESLLRAEIDRRWPADCADELDGIGRYALLPTGKLLRPIMTLLCAAAVGGDPEVVVPAALAMEYLHVATLVHDDIIDADDLRRARPTVHVAYGIPDAIVAGDHLIFAAFEAIAECAGHPIAPRALMAATAALATAGADLCRGQLLESRLAGDPTVDVSAYLTVAALKTGALFGAVCRVGAALGGGTAEQIDGLGRYGEELGIAFQIRDDLLACVLTAEATGKPATSDLANGRATLPVLFAYQAGDAAVRERLVALLRSGSASVPELAEFHGLLAGTGALTAARERAAQSGRIAMSALAPLGQSESVAALASVVRWAIGPET